MSTRKPRKTAQKDLKGQLPPAKYNEMLKHLNLVDVYIKEVRSTLYSRVVEKATLDFDEQAEVTEYTGSKATIEVSYHLKAKSGRVRLFETKVKYVVKFTVSEDVPKEFFELYKTLSLPLQTFPYLRECVNSMISRMGLPPLILPLRKFLVGSDQ